MPAVLAPDLRTPQTLSACSSAAIEMQQAGDYMGAIDAYKTGLAIDPKRVDALSNLGAAYVHLGQFDEGIAQYNAALEIDPNNARCA